MSQRNTSAEGEFLAVDYGLKRVGVARINSHAQIAEYLPVISRESDEQVIEELLEIADSLSSHGIVVGLPRGLDGQDSEQTKITQVFIELLSEKAGSSLEVYAIDEAGTTEAAKERAGEISAGIDSVAAGIIAEDFITLKDVLKHKIK